MRNAFKIFHIDYSRVNHPRYQVLVEWNKGKSVCVPNYFPAHKWTHRHPMGGPLCAFDTYDHCLLHIDSEYPDYGRRYFAIFPCTVDEEVQEDYLYLGDRITEPAAGFSQDWKNYFCMPTRHTPVGTILCDKIRIDSTQPVEQGWKFTREGASINYTFRRLSYEKGIWTVPLPGWGPLAVFDFKETAMQWYTTYTTRWESDWILQQCLYVPVSKYKRTHGWTTVFHPSELPNHGRVSFAKKLLPVGTVLAERVMIL